MAQHILRKDLKKDEFRDTLVHGAESLASHQKLLALIIGAALIVLLGVFGWSSYSKRQTAKAGAALDDAMKVFQARVRAPLEQPEPGELSYIDDKNKYADAERKFLQVAAEYGRTKPGQIARYYAALCETHLNQFDAAEKNLNLVGSGGDDGFGGLARFELAGIYARTGKGPQAVDIYKQLSDKPTIFVPKPTAMLALANYYRKSDPAEATKVYNQVKKDFPDTPAAEEADQGLELLNTKS